MAMVNSRIIVIFLLIAFPSTGHAMTLRDFLVGGAIKNLARIFVKTTSLPKLKTKYINQIASMRDDKFRKYYTKFYVVYNQLPLDIKENFVFTENATKSEIIAKIEQVQKRDLMVIISKVPSEFIVDQTRYYSKSKDKYQNSIDEQRIWKRIIEKV